MNIDNHMVMNIEDIEERELFLNDTPPCPVCSTNKWMSDREYSDKQWLCVECDNQFDEEDLV